MKQTPVELPEHCPATEAFSELDLTPLRPGWWRVNKEFRYRAACCFLIPFVDVPAGFECDLDSVPRLPLAYWLAKGRTIKGAVAHDWLYKSGRLSEGGAKVGRRMADRIFLAAMRDEGVHWRHRWPIWLMVRLFGWRGWYRYRRAEGRA
ncbi:DUF1353 domain-containing protein [Pseudazoarcus pumilus]|uniref:DUF1353 domain-containing protein n=1 Tax=Pseudazoarcus pumilus TaxID=2067960 RepID=A0A2I6S9E8_9RHOO|nr:DUF1353 domain-containing protein [Pseudazoarcus pumilus]AUN95890.1 hypothetical protein C0099_13690 [Pseudazoarcus pumilus]